MNLIGTENFNTNRKITIKVLQFMKVFYARIEDVPRKHFEDYGNPETSLHEINRKFVKELGKLEEDKAGNYFVAYSGGSAWGNAVHCVVVPFERDDKTQCFTGTISVIHVNSRKRNELHNVPLVVVHNDVNYIRQLANDVVAIPKPTTAGFTKKAKVSTLFPNSLDEYKQLNKSHRKKIRELSRHCYMLTEGDLDASWFAFKKFFVGGNCFAEIYDDLIRLAKMYSNYDAISDVVNIIESFKVKMNS